MLFLKNLRKAIINVKVIPSEECVQQHKLVVCDLKVKIPPIKKRSFTPRIRTWKLNDPEIANQFCVDFKLKVANAASNSDDCVESAWSLLKKPLLEAAVVTCGLSKKHQWRRETWWWNNEVDEAIKEKTIQALQSIVKRRQ